VRAARPRGPARGPRSWKRSARGGRDTVACRQRTGLAGGSAATSERPARSW
jgi:hypothetical protein